MEFRLVYRGPLQSGRSAGPAEKHRIREAFHPQLRALWQEPPLIGRLNLDSPFGDPRMTSTIREIGPLACLPLVTAQFNLVAHLDVTLLRPEPAGAVITTGGDLDNRIKTLFDALRMPKDPSELPKDTMPLPPNQPLYCLLEDDALITEVAVRADRLLGATDLSEVFALIHVRIKTTSLTYDNMDLSS
jgi:hypothetical protein